MVDILTPPPPDRYNFAADIFARNIDRTERIAYIDDETKLSYGELIDQARRFGAGLLALGLRREERVLLLMYDSVTWPVAFLGSLYAGVVPVAVNSLLTADDYAYMLEHSAARAAVVSSTLLDVLNRAKGSASHQLEHIITSGGATDTDSEIAMQDLIANHAPLANAADTLADDVAFWLYSSGSTGRPKGTVHVHSSPYWTAELYGRGVLDMRQDDICFSAAKLFFAYGLGNSLSFPLSVGATVVLMSGRPTPEAIFEKWATHRPTLFFSAPTSYAGLLASPELPQAEDVTLRLCSSAGEALPEDLGSRFSAHFGVDVIDGIGSTEMLHIFLSNAPGRVRYGSTGWPVPGYEIELRGEDDQPVPAGTTGELFIKGPTAAIMYWGDRKKSRQTFQGIWTKSGDQYVENDDGSYTYIGRSDDMFKVSGQYVSPFEVEATLIQHDAVLESAVVGLADHDGLIKSKAFVVLTPGSEVTADELKQFVKERLAPFKYPRSVEFLAELPKTATGKIMRFKLRE
ncbi:MAG: benzoate-CoA ligase [Candidatus Azotimanducaceae bacterium]|jgi:benzoate-CoA ligase